MNAGRWRPQKMFELQRDAGKRPGPAAWKGCPTPALRGAGLIGFASGGVCSYALASVRNETDYDDLTFILQPDGR
jgi:hypothetical protein